MTKLYRKDENGNFRIVKLRDELDYDELDESVQLVLNQYVDFEKNILILSSVKDVKIALQQKRKRIEEETRPDRLQFYTSKRYSSQIELENAYQLSLQRYKNRLEDYNTAYESVLYNLHDFIEAEDNCTLRSFNDISKYFNLMIDKVSTKRNKTVFKNLMGQASLQNTDEDKIKYFVENSIPLYRDILRSFRGEHSRLAKCLNKFYSENFGINLPAKLASNQKFCLDSMKLEDRNRNDGETPKYFTRQFAALTGQSHASLTECFNAETIKEKAILEVSAYITHRASQNDYGFYKNEKYRRETKVIIGNVLKIALSGQDFELSNNDLDTLLDGGLGVITRKYHAMGLLPPQLTHQITKKINPEYLARKREKVFSVKNEPEVLRNDVQFALMKKYQGR